MNHSELQKFFDIGYVILPDLFSHTEVTQIRAAFGRLQERAATVNSDSMISGSWFVVDGKAIDRVVWCGACEPELLEIGRDPRLTQPASELLDSKEMDQLICQAHFKLPADGVSFDWHQDSEHRRYGTNQWVDKNGKGSYVQTILAVDEMKMDNGPLMLIPYSCQWGHLDLNKRKYRVEFTPTDGIQSVTLKVGSVLLLNPYVVHSSMPNESAVSRRVFINGYAYPGANFRQYPGEGSGRRVVAP